MRALFRTGQLQTGQGVGSSRQQVPWFPGIGQGSGALRQAGKGRLTEPEPSAPTERGHSRTLDRHVEVRGRSSPIFWVSQDLGSHCAFTDNTYTGFSEFPNWETVNHM